MRRTDGREFSYGFPGSPSRLRKGRTPQSPDSVHRSFPASGRSTMARLQKGSPFFSWHFSGSFLFLIPGLIVWLYAMYDAYAVATKMNTGEIEFSEMQMFHMVIVHCVCRGRDRSRASPRYLNHDDGTYGPAGAGRDRGLFLDVWEERNDLTEEMARGNQVPFGLIFIHASRTILKKMYSPSLLISCRERSLLTGI